MQYLGIDCAHRRAVWCARGEGGAITDEGLVSADEDGSVKLVLARGAEVKACVEMMSGAVWVRDRLATAGWEVQVAHAGKVRRLAPLARKTDKVDARVLAELCRRDLVPALWIPSLDDRAMRERLRRRTHPVRLRASAMNRISSCSLSGGCGCRSRGCAPRTRRSYSRRAASTRPGALDRRGAGGGRPARRADRAALRGVTAVRGRRSARGRSSPMTIAVPR
jgi:hypothetical protein